MAAAPATTRTFIVKVAGTCNLNCKYCYVFNLGDTTYRFRPRVMSEEVAEAALGRIFGYARRTNLRGVVIALHGGEPLLVGKTWLRWLLKRIRSLESPGLGAVISLQTNGTLLDEEWLDLLSSESVRLGVSIDGPRQWHDRHRVNHSGRGSYSQVRRAIDLLVDAGDDAPVWGVLTVANPRYPGVEIYRHFLDIGIRNMDFLWPDYHHDMPPPWEEDELAAYFIRLFDSWFDARDPTVHIRWFESAIELLLGGKPRIDALGPQPVDTVVVETDGSLEPLDVLRICGDGMTRVGLNVKRHDVEHLHSTELFQAGLHNQRYLPDECRKCPVYGVCGGGYLPHRWGLGRGFGNPSIHSKQLFAIISHIARRVRADFAAAGYGVNAAHPAAQGR